MKAKLAIVLAVLSVILPLQPTFAADSKPQAVEQVKLAQSMQKISAQAQALQKQMQGMQSQLQELRNQEQTLQQENAQLRAQNKQLVSANVNLAQTQTTNAIAKANQPAQKPAIGRNQTTKQPGVKAATPKPRAQRQVPQTTIHSQQPPLQFAQANAQSGNISSAKAMPVSYSRHSTDTQRKSVHQPQKATGAPAAVHRGHGQGGGNDSHTHTTDATLVSTTAGTTPVETQEQNSQKLLHSVSVAGTYVYTSPYFGVRSQFNGSNLIVNTSSVNKDLNLLQMRQQVQAARKAAGIKQPTHPIIALSGEVEGQAIYNRTYAGDNDSDIDFTDGEIDLAALINPWITAFLTFSYDDTPLPAATAGSGRRINNSEVELDQGFFSIGNLDKLPMYFSMGQLYVPFGQYSSYMVSDELPKLLGRTKSRAVVLGYQQPGNAGVYSSLFAARGDTRTSTNEVINEWGANLGYVYDYKKWNANISASFLNNLADSDGMQDNGVDSNMQFSGFDRSSSTERINHYVPAVDVQSTLGYGPYSLLTEYVGATRHFDSRNLSFDNHGAQPQAFHIEGVYTFNILGRPASLAAGYDQSWQALGLNLPRRRYIGTLNYSFWRDTIASLEFRHDINYNSGTSANGNVRTSPSTPLSPAGHVNNVLTAQFDVYF